MNRTQTGFTLLELMVALTIAAILMTVALPNYREFIMSNRMTTATNDFVTTLAMARSEAVKRGEGVTICSSDDMETCTATAWNLGWIIMVTSTSELLRVHEPLDSAITLTNAAANTAIEYRPTGFLNGGAANTFDFCDSRTGETGRQIAISATGRPTNITPYPTCA
jgi:type IV fimbrial biogenesis protein FimT